MNQISEEELIKTIADFLEMGHIENIVAMFKEDTNYYDLSGRLIQDERFMVRMGMAVLFEELVKVRPHETTRAIPSLSKVLRNKTPYVRGEAANLLGIIGTDEALGHLKKMKGEKDEQILEIIRDILTRDSENQEHKRNEF